MKKVGKVLGGKLFCPACTLLMACSHLHLKEENEKNRNKPFDFTALQILTQMSDQETWLTARFSKLYSYVAMRDAPYFYFPSFHWAQRKCISYFQTSNIIYPSQDPNCAYTVSYTGKREFLGVFRWWFRGVQCQLELWRWPTLCSYITGSPE